VNVALLRTGLVALALAAVPLSAAALPHRSIVARPLPPGILAAARDDTAAGVLTQADARTLAESLLARVSTTRGLKILRPVPVTAASRAQVRDRLEEITRQDQIEARLRQDEVLLRYLGLLPADQDLARTYHDLLAEQLAGFYDIDARQLVLADWLPRDLQRGVASHELTHALQDQHFSLRVRKRLGFESTDAEAAWHALVEGDATAVMAEIESGRPFHTLLDSTAAVQAPDAVRRAVSGQVDSERFRAAPEALRAELGFPYAHGVRYVAQLYRKGGWKAVDDAYIHPPLSTEQILHADRMGNSSDAPVRIQIPDVSGLLGEGWSTAASGTLGEYDLDLYLRAHVDPEVAHISAEGWAGCSYALYQGPAGARPVFALVSQWDSEDDAVEFYGGLIGALEARFPEQAGWAEASSQDRIIWALDESRRSLNVLQLRERQVVCIEALPEAQHMRIVQKLDTFVKVDDPAPEVRASSKDQLPWNRSTQGEMAGRLVPRLTLPDGWEPVATPSDSQAVVEARRGPARLVLAVDRSASGEVGLDGYAHQVAEKLQARGRDVYVQIDVDYPRSSGALYQMVFTQTEGGQQTIYYLGVAGLGQGYASLLVHAPMDSLDKDQQATLHDDFYRLLDTLDLAPAVPADTAPATAGSQGASRD
jgi:hypothetical protein